MRDDFNKFVSTFDNVQNALEQRNLVRWNGRPIRNKENLAEHTHLVVACAIKIMDSTIKYLVPEDSYSRYDIVKGAMLHDSLEILRGDILSITKDAIPEIRKSIEEEENEFIQSQLGWLNETERTIVRLADLMACYKFLESELQYPNNDYAKEVYVSCKRKYDIAFTDFVKGYGVKIEKTEIPDKRFAKGYLEDAGVDVILDKAVEFLPMSTASINLDIKVTPNKEQMAFLCARTSAAAKGLCVAMCPIDPDFNGNVTAIVHNISNNIVRYEVGEAFCQVVMTPIITNRLVHPKKEGKRSDGKLGSTGV